MFEYATTIKLGKTEQNTEVESQAQLSNKTASTDSQTLEEGEGSVKGPCNEQSSEEQPININDEIKEGSLDGVEANYRCGEDSTNLGHLDTLDGLLIVG